MRSYQLTSRGRQITRMPCGGRNVLMDHMYPNKKIPRDELEALVGPGHIDEELRPLLKKGYVEEVRNDF